MLAGISHSSELPARPPARRQDIQEPERSHLLGGIRAREALVLEYRQACSQSRHHDGLFVLRMHDEATSQPDRGACPVPSLGIVIHPPQDRLLRPVRSEHLCDDTRKVLRSRDVCERRMEDLRLPVCVCREPDPCGLECTPSVCHRYVRLHQP